MINKGVFILMKINIGGSDLSLDELKLMLSSVTKPLNSSLKSYGEKDLNTYRVSSGKIITI